MAGQRPEMLNALLIRPIKILTSKMSIKKSGRLQEEKAFRAANRGEECPGDSNGILRYVERCSDATTIYAENSSAS